MKHRKRSGRNAAHASFAIEQAKLWLGVDSGGHAPVSSMSDEDVIGFYLQSIGTQAIKRIISKLEMNTSDQIGCSVGLILIPVSSAKAHHSLNASPLLGVVWIT